MFKKSLACGVAAACLSALLVLGGGAVTEYDMNYNNGKYEPTIVIDWLIVVTWAIAVALLVGVMVFCVVWVLEYDRDRRSRHVHGKQPEVAQDQQAQTQAVAP